MTSAGRIALASTSAIGLALAHPAADQGWLAWAALAPLLVAVDGLSARRAALLGLAFGYANAALTYQWIFDLDGFGFPQALVLGIYLSAYPAFFCVSVGRLRKSGLSQLLTLPALWVGLEFARAHAGFLAFPWANLAHTQTHAPAWLQIASVTGEAGVSFLIVLTNTALARAFLRRASRLEVVTVAGVLALVFGTGWLATRSPLQGNDLRVAVVQPNIPLDDPQTPASLKARFEKLRRLSLAAAVGGVDLVVWPETAVRSLAKTPALEASVLELATQLSASLIVGSSDAEKLRVATRERDAVLEYHNSAYHVQPNRRLGSPYHKLRLLPFGEYLPYEEWIAWPNWLAPKLFDVRAGGEQTLFTLADGTAFSVLICWENLFADLARSSVRNGARLLVHISNDNWFGATAEPRQHFGASVLRAVETGVPVLIASNTGPSQIIDGRGRRMTELPTLFEEGTLTATIRIPHSPTLYVAIGEVFAWCCMALALVGYAWKKPD